MASLPPPPPPPSSPDLEDEEFYEPPRGRWMRVVALVLVLALAVSFGVDFMLARFAEEAPLDRSSESSANHDRCYATSVPLYPEPESLEQQIERTTAQVEALRALERTDELDARVVPSEGLGKRVGRSLQVYTDKRAERDARILTTLGIVEPGFDLKASLEEMLTTQVAGLYMPKTERLLVASENGREPLSPANTTTLAHEIQHAIADQHFDFPTSEKVPRGQEDETLAHRSLIEGDATVTQRAFAQRALSPDQQAAMLEDPELRSTLADYYELPSYLRKAFEFPYVAGAAFVQALCAEGGWDLVDRAHAEPPTTSAQILFPERYLAGETEAEPPQLGAPGPGWDAGWNVSFGAADLLLMLELPGGDEGRAIDDPLGAASGWAGGGLTLWTRGGDSAVGIGIAQRRDTDLCPPLGAWYLASFPDSQPQATETSERFAFSDDERAGVIACADGEVRVGIAPDLATARALLGGRSNQ